MGNLSDTIPGDTSEYNMSHFIIIFTHWENGVVRVIFTCGCEVRGEFRIPKQLSNLGRQVQHLSRQLSTQDDPSLENVDHDDVIVLNDNHCV